MDARSAPYFDWEAMFPDPPPDLGVGPRAVAGSAVPLPEPAVRDLASILDLPPPRRRLLEGLALLWHDHWDAAHAVAQSHEGLADHDFLHAILHRREGDFDNARYWFRSAGRHPCLASLERDAGGILQASPLRDLLLPGGHWSCEAFVAAVRQAPDRDTDLLVRLQALEFRAFAAWLASGT